MSNVPIKVLRHAWDLVEYLDYDLTLSLGTDLDLRQISVLIADEKGPVRAGAAQLVGTKDGGLGVLIKPKIGNPSNKQPEPAEDPSGGETA